MVLLSDGVALRWFFSVGFACSWFCLQAVFLLKGFVGLADQLADFLMGGESAGISR
jgi:hypothetical protein